MIISHKGITQHEKQGVLNQPHSHTELKIHCCQTKIQEEAIT